SPLRAVGTADASQRLQIFDRDWNAVDLAQQLASERPLLGRASLLQGKLGRGREERVQDRIEPLDARQNRLGDLDGRDLSRTDQSAEFEGRGKAQVRRIHVWLRSGRQAVTGCWA